MKNQEKQTLEEGRSTLRKDVQFQLDRACLLFYISLLDHTLKGNLFASVVIGFLAVLGVDSEKKTLKDPYSYTPYLLGFVKIAQMLVIQRAVTITEDRDINHPVDVLDKIRERFIIYRSRSPFN